MALLLGASNKEDNAMLPSVPDVLEDAEISNPLGPELRTIKDTQGNPCIKFDLEELQSHWREYAVENNKEKILHSGTQGTKFTYASLQVVYSALDILRLLNN